MGDEARWCRKCELPFIGPTCEKGHPVFMYSKKIPEGKEDLLNLSTADRLKAAEAAAKAVQLEAAEKM